jgi:hypothetical protein
LTLGVLLVLAFLASCASSRGGLPATLQVQGSGLLAAGYDGRTLAIAYQGAGAGAIVASDGGMPLAAPITWDGAGLYVRVRDGNEARYPAELAGGLVLVRVPAELAEQLGVLPFAAWLELVFEELAEEAPAP